MQTEVYEFRRMEVSRVIGSGLARMCCRSHMNPGGMCLNSSASADRACTRCTALHLQHTCTHCHGEGLLFIGARPANKASSTSTAMIRNSKQEQEQGKSISNSKHR
jgi:hypothetical protein